MDYYNPEGGGRYKRTRRTFLRTAATGVVANGLVSTGSAADEERGDEEDCIGTKYLATTNPGVVYVHRNGSLEMIGDPILSGEGSVTALQTYGGSLIAATTTDTQYNLGNGAVYEFTGSEWRQLGGSLDDEVPVLAVYEGNLYAGTSYGAAKLYRYDETTDNWSNVTTRTDWQGFSAAHVTADGIVLGDSLHDIFGVYSEDSDGEGQFVQEANQGGSCIYDFAEYDGDLYAGAWSGYLYKRDGGEWNRVLNEGIAGFLQLEAHDGSLFIGDSDGNLYSYEGPGTSRELVREFGDSIVTLESYGDTLYIGTGQNAGQYEESYRNTGQAAVYRYSDSTIDELSESIDFGSAVQEVYVTDDTGSDIEFVSVDAPPTAVETDQTFSFTIVADIDSCDSDSLEVALDTTVTRSDGRIMGDAGSIETTVIDDDRVAVTASFLPADAFDGISRGLEWEIDIELSLGHRRLSRTFAVYAFETVDRVAALPGISSDKSTVVEPETIPGHVRTISEFVNEYYASGLGGMGAKGFDIQIAVSDETVLNGGIQAPERHSYYDDGGSDETPENSMDFTQDVITRADERGVDFREYDTALVVGLHSDGEDGPDDVLSRPFYRGGVSDLYVDLFGLEISFGGVDEDAIDEIGSFSTSNGVIDGVYNPLRRPSWRHELGHSLGLGNSVGFPDLYHEEGRLNTFGIIGEWGLMGNGEVISSYCRWIGENPADVTEGWFDADINFHLLDDETLSLQPLTEKDIGDDTTFLVSVASHDVSDSVLDTFTSAVIVDLYILEHRRSRSSSIAYPELFDQDLETVPLSPPGADASSGTAIYKFGGFRIQDATLDDVADVIKEGSLDRLFDLVEEVTDDALQLWYLSENTDFERDIEIDKLNEYTISPADPEFEDTESSVIFELDQSDPKDVTVSLDTGGLEDAVDYIIEPIGDGIDWGVETIEDGSEWAVDTGRDGVEWTVDTATDTGEYVVEKGEDGKEYVEEKYEEGKDFVGGLFGSGIPDSLPPLDAMAVTTDGNRVGIDPETGDVINEIDGARVSQRGNASVLTIPNDVDVSVAVSGQRLHEALRELGFEPPEIIPYEQRILTDTDDTVSETNGIPVLEGRTEQRTRSITTADGYTVAAASTTATIEPDRINSASNGNFVTVSIALPSALEGSSIAHESAMIDSVRAVTDESYGFVRNPERTSNGDVETVHVKFWREDIVEHFGTGTHECTVSVIAGETPLRGAATLEIFERPANRNQRKGRGNSVGNGR